MNILFITPYPHHKAPSQRFRFEQYLRYLKEKGWRYTLAPFFDEAGWQILYKPGFILQKASHVIKGMLKRAFLLFSLYKYDFVFIHREATPIGPPWFEWIAANMLKKEIIYDFDDAIWLDNTSESNKIAAGLKWHHKVNNICKWAYKVSCGNKYLCDYAAQFNKQVVHNPTTIDTENLHNPALYIKPNTIKPIIGWTGTHSTLVYLEPLVPLLKKLEQAHDFEFWVIGNANPDYDLRSFKFVPWKLDTEIEDLNKLTIGLMPLTDDKWAKGKCGFKALQYMALGIPALVSPVGVNTEIVSHGVSGFICDTLKDWEEALLTLLNNAPLREQIGKQARLTIENRYSVNANKANFLSLFS